MTDYEFITTEITALHEGKKRIGVMIDLPRACNGKTFDVWENPDGTFSVELHDDSQKKEIHIGMYPDGYIYYGAFKAEQHICGTCIIIRNYIELGLYETEVEYGFDGEIISLHMEYSNLNFRTDNRASEDTGVKQT